MKRFLTLLTVFAILSVLCFHAFADGETEAEAEYVGTDVETDVETEAETVEGEAETVEGETEEAAETTEEGMTIKGVAKNFAIRIYEWVVENKELIASIVLDGIIIGFLYLVRKSKTKMDDKIVTQLTEIKKESSNAEETSANVTAAVNGMIDGYNDMQGAYAAQQSMEDDRNKVVASVLETNLTILGILTTVYANSKNLPQGTKDLINYKYAQCLKALDNDEQMKAIADLIRNAVGVNVTEGETHDEQD